MKRYLEHGPEYCRLTYKEDGASKPVSVWAEVGPARDNVQMFYEVDEHGERQCVILTMVGEARWKPAKLNLDTDKLERVRK
jgi:hypothetical protein